MNRLEDVSKWITQRDRKVIVAISILVVFGFFQNCSNSGYQSISPSLTRDPASEKFDFREYSFNSIQTLCPASGSSCDFYSQTGNNVVDASDLAQFSPGWTRGADNLESASLYGGLGDDIYVIDLQKIHKKRTTIIIDTEGANLIHLKSLVAFNSLCKNETVQFSLNHNDLYQIFGAAKFRFKLNAESKVYSWDELKSYLNISCTN